MNQEAITAVVQSYFDRLQAMDMAGWRDIFADDGVLYDPVGNPPSKAHENAEKFFGMLSAVFKTMTLSADQIFVAGAAAAAAKWTMQVVGKNGRQGQAEGISTFELNEAGKIKVVSAYWDDAALMAQIRD